MKPSQPVGLVPNWFRALKAPKQPKCAKCGLALSATPQGLVRWGCDAPDCPYDNKE